MLGCSWLNHLNNTLSYLSRHCLPFLAFLQVSTLTLSAISFHLNFLSSSVASCSCMIFSSSQSSQFRVQLPLSSKLCVRSSRVIQFQSGERKQRAGISQTVVKQPILPTPQTPTPPVSATLLKQTTLFVRIDNRSQAARCRFSTKTIEMGRDSTSPLQATKKSYNQAAVFIPCFCRFCPFQLLIANNIIKLTTSPMHFTKFLTVSQIQTNTQLISEHLNKPSSTTKDNHIETESPKLRKKLVNQFPTNLHTPGPDSSRSLESLQFKLFSSGTFESSGLSSQQSPKHRGFPVDSDQERPFFGTHSQQLLTKHPKNHVIYENEQAEKEDQGQIKSKYLFNGSQVTQAKFSFKDRKASCNLQAASFFKGPIRKNSDQSSQLDQNKREKALIKKKSQGWDQNNNFRFGSSNNASEGKSHEENHQNLLPQPAREKNERKKSQNVESQKKQVPSFLINSKLHRNSVDAAELPQKKKLAIQDFVIIKQLGQGTFGRVVLAAEKESHMICAIKIMSKRQLRENNMVEQLLREIKIQMYISHPNIVKIYGFFDDLLHFYILIECALDGHLSQFIKKTPFPIPELQAGIMLNQICSAVSLLHSESIIHRDLKPQNVLLHDGVVKICDFGWSVRRDGKLRTTFCGTPVYLCPQILIGDEYDESVDIWTIGIILYEMIYKTNPFRITTKEELINILNNPIDFKENIPITKMVREFIEICLAKRAVQRPNIRELMLHQFILKAQSAEEQRQKH